MRVIYLPSTHREKLAFIVLLVSPLKINTTVAFGSVWLTPRMADFLELYPHIDVSLALSDDDLDLSMREADVAIRMTAVRRQNFPTMRHSAFMARASSNVITISSCMYLHPSFSLLSYLGCLGVAQQRVTGPH